MTASPGQRGPVTPVTPARSTRLWPDVTGPRLLPPEHLWHERWVTVFVRTGVRGREAGRSRSRSGHHDRDRSPPGGDRSRSWPGGPRSLQELTTLWVSAAATWARPPVMRTAMR